jgi:UDP-N-acetylglucosamine 2-epimerase (non-hydrolysing)
VRVLYVVGARPNFVKMAPVIAELRRRRPEATHVLVHTGQHYDWQMSDIFLSELGVPAPDYDLEIGSGSHATQTARVLERLEVVVRRERPDLMLVPGDVNSTLAAALVAAKAPTALGHVESGLRSRDLAMPEEVNRIVADRFSDLLFVHSEDAIENLEREGLDLNKVHFVGNTMIDSLVALEDRFRSREAWRGQGVRPGEYLLVTLHRPALVDTQLLDEVMARLEALAVDVPVVFPVHPRTRKRLEGRRSTAGLHLLDPVGYLDFLSLEADARAVITDSGGVQEETTYLGVPCFTLRNTTERPVTVRLGTNTVLGLDPRSIDGVLPALARRTRDPDRRPPKWDGSAAERIADVVVSSLERHKQAPLGAPP